MGRTQRIGVVAVMVLVAAGCATGRLAGNAKKAADAGDWDTAVVYYRQAVARDPDSLELKIALERTTREASQAHLKRARELEAQNQLPGAAAEYRLAAELDPANTYAQIKAGQIERVLRAQLESSRPAPRLEELRQAGAQSAQLPRLDPRVPVVSLRFGTTAGVSVRDILNTIAQAAGITVTYDQGLPTLNQPYSIELTNAPLEEALNQVLTANTLTYKILNPQTIFVYADTQAGRLKYDDVYIQTFYLAHTDPNEIMTILTQVVMTGPLVRPVLTPNKISRTIVARATVPILELIDKVIRANDKPTAEVLIDVQIMQVDRGRAKQLGLDLGNFAIGLTFSPEVTPPQGTSPQFNLNTLQEGIRAADFFVTLPTINIRLLEQDQKTRILAKTQLRGRAGAPLNLQLGDEIPYATTTFNPAQGIQSNVIPTQINYKIVGLTVQFTPQVTAREEIILENLTVQKSARGPDVNVQGQNQPSFSSSTAVVTLRLRDGETNMLAGLFSVEERNTFRTLPGLSQLPVLRNFFGHEDSVKEESELIVLVTPHILMSQDIKPEDVAPIFAGTANNIGSGGPPRLVAPGAPPPTVPLTGPLPAGTTPPPAAGTTPPPPAQTTPPAGRAVGVVPVEPVGAGAPPQPQITVSAGAADLSMSGGPYPIAIRANNVSQLGALSLTVTYNPAVLRATVVNPGTFMQQGDVTATFVPKIDNAAGRIDISISRPAERPGATGSGDIAAIMFEPVAPGSSPVTITGAAASTTGQVITAQMVPASVTVRR